MGRMVGLRLFIASLFAVSAMASSSVGWPAEVDADRQWAHVDEADRYFAQFFRRESPGCSVSLRKNRNLVFEKGYGSARLPASGEPESNRLPMTPKRRIRVASLSKPVLSMGILHLRDALARTGVELLERTLGEIYPLHFKSTRFSKVTVRQILSHTAGFTREPNSVPTTLAGLPARMAAEADAWANGAIPGTKFEYSNVGYMLLADILTTQSGLDYNEYLKRNIFQPIGMTASSFEDPVPLQIKGEVAKGYEKGGTEYVFLDIEPARRVLLGSGGLLTTSEDLSRLSLVVQDRKLLSADSWKAAFTPSRPSLDVGESYGLGWGVYSSGEGSFQEHTGGGYGAHTLLQVMTAQVSPCPYTAVILCNFESGTMGLFRVTKASATMRKIFCGP